RRPATARRARVGNSLREGWEVGVLSEGICLARRPTGRHIVRHEHDIADGPYSLILISGGGGARKQRRQMDRRRDAALGVPKLHRLGTVRAMLSLGVAHLDKTGHESRVGPRAQRELGENELADGYRIVANEELRAQIGVALRLLGGDPFLALLERFGGDAL